MNEDLGIDYDTDEDPLRVVNAILIPLGVIAVVSLIAAVSWGISRIA